MASAATNQQLAFIPARFHDMPTSYAQHLGGASRSPDDKTASHHLPYDEYNAANYIGFSDSFNNVDLQQWQQQQLQYSPTDQRQQNSNLLTSHSPSSQASLHRRSFQSQQLHHLNIFGQQSPEQFQPPQSDYMLAAPQRVHHHSLPTPSPIQHQHSNEHSERSSRERDPGNAPNLVGHEGMPEPAPRPKGPKLKFTPADDALLVKLKEEKGLTWKQIADFFPGRTSGTLQVRYCTKLKAKTTVWTDDMVQKLKSAMAEYENDRWRIIASKVGNGFSATACHDRAVELAVEEPEGSDLVMGDLDDESE